MSPVLGVRKFLSARNRAFFLVKIMAKRPLTQKQELFIEEYLRCDNASEAYRIAYNAAKMKPATIHRKAKECVDNGKIAASIKAIKDEVQKKIAKKYEVTTDRLTKEYARIAFLDFRIFFDKKGFLIHPDKLSDDAAAVLAGLETTMVGAGDEVDYVKKIKTYDKLKALNDLGRNLGFFKEDNDQGRDQTVIYNKVKLPKEMLALIPLRRGADDER